MTLEIEGFGYRELRFGCVEAQVRSWGLRGIRVNGMRLLFSGENL